MFLSLVMMRQVRKPIIFVKCIQEKWSHFDCFLWVTNPLINNLRHGESDEDERINSITSLRFVIKEKKVITIKTPDRLQRVVLRNQCV